LQFWVVQTLNSLALGGLLFLLAAGFSLIFGLMRIANLTHGALFMVGAYLGATLLKIVPSLWLAALLSGAAVAAFGGLLERFILRKLGGNILGQVLVTLGIAYILADLCLVVWGGDPIPIPTPALLQQPLRVAGFMFPAYRLAVVVVALLAAIGLYFLIEKTRLGAMIRAGVDDMDMARAVGIPVSRLFTVVFCLGAGLAGAGGVIGGLVGAFVGSFITGFVYTFGVALFPQLAYVVLFLPMIVVIAFRPRGLFGKFAA
jgi:branched-chain amino acid transport system permease protein